MTFGMLPDDVLLNVFDFFVEDFKSFKEKSWILKEPRVDGWVTLAHVCQRWRSIVFQSPLRLNLRLLCTPKTPARDALDVWPRLPLIIWDVRSIFDGKSSSVGNIIAALEHNDRACRIELKHYQSLEMGYITNSAAMHRPFPELTHLLLKKFESFEYGPGPILSDSFLGGTAPRLRSLELDNVPFPGLPKLLLSTTHLVNLSLHKIPRSSDIPPEAMVTSLSALTNLEFLCLEFRYAQPPSHPALEGQRPPPPPLTRSILPSLTKFRFNGFSEYLEEILAGIDAPRLDELQIIYFNQIIFGTPQLLQFFSRRPTLRVPEEGHIAFNSKAIIVKFPSQTSEYDVLSVEVPFTAPERQLSSLEQVCASSFPFLSTLEGLYIFEDQNAPRWQDDIENTLWLALLRPFAAVKSLYLCEKIIPHIAPALQELVGDRTTEVLPTLENIFLETLQPPGPLQGGIEKFVAVRQLTSHPVAVSRWDMDRKKYRYP